MKYLLTSFPEDLNAVTQIAEQAFSVTPDASLTEWFSFLEMKKNVLEGRGICVKAISELGKPVGMIFARQEDPINSREGLEKWMIEILAVIPEVKGQGVGSRLIKEIEKEAKARGAVKMFVYTNKDDARVVHFYQKNGYKDAGWVRDYQYGKGNSAVFLLKYLSAQ